MKHYNFLGLPTYSLNILSTGLTFVLVCLGVRVVRVANLAVKVANTQLITSNSADKLESLTDRLQEQAEIIEQKDNAYQQLEATYRAYQNSQVGNVEVDEAFEQIKRLPQVENLDEIESELLETEEALLEVNE